MISVTVTVFDSDVISTLLFSCEMWITAFSTERCCTFTFVEVVSTVHNSCNKYEIGYTSISQRSTGVSASLMHMQPSCIIA